jgi:hypothetical protein
MELVNDTKLKNRSEQKYPNEHALTTVNEAVPSISTIYSRGQSVT